MLKPITNKNVSQKQNPGKKTKTKPWTNPCLDNNISLIDMSDNNNTCDRCIIVILNLEGIESIQK